MNLNLSKNPEKYQDLTLIKESLSLKISQEQQIPLHIVKAVLDNQFRTARQALATHNSVEIAGFGKFVFKENRAKTKVKLYTDYLAKLELSLITPVAHNTEYRQISIEEKIKKIKEFVGLINKKIRS